MTTRSTSKAGRAAQAPAKTARKAPANTASNAQALAGAKVALGWTIGDSTPDGLEALSQSVGNGLARFALAIYLARESGMKGVDVATVTGLRPERVSKLALAGMYLARCGAGASKVTRAATALGEAWSQPKMLDKFGALSGARLVAAIDREHKAWRTADTANKRGAARTPDKAGTDAATQASIDAKRTDAERVGAAHDALKAVKRVPQTGACKALAASILAQALRVAALAGVDAADVVAASAEVAA